MSQISEKTLIPLSLVMSILGGAGWLTYIYFQGEANATTISEVKQDIQELKQADYLFKNEIIERLARIEEKLNNFKRGK